MGKHKKLPQCDMDMIRAIAINNVVALETALLQGANPNLYITENLMEQIKQQELTSLKMAYMKAYRITRLECDAHGFKTPVFHEDGFKGGLDI